METRGRAQLRHYRLTWSVVLKENKMERMVEEEEEEDEEKEKIDFTRPRTLTFVTEESESDVLPEKCLANSLTDGSITGISASKSRSDDTVLHSLGVT